MLLSNYPWHVLDLSAIPTEGDVTSHLAIDLLPLFAALKDNIHPIYKLDLCGRDYVTEDNLPSLLEMLRSNTHIMHLEVADTCLSEDGYLVEVCELLEAGENTTLTHVGERCNCGRWLWERLREVEKRNYALWREKMETAVSILVATRVLLLSSGDVEDLGVSETEEREKNAEEEEEGFFATVRSLPFEMRELIIIHMNGGTASGGGEVLSAGEVRDIIAYGMRRENLGADRKKFVTACLPSVVFFDSADEEQEEFQLVKRRMADRIARQVREIQQQEAATAKAQEKQILRDLMFSHFG